MSTDRYQARGVSADKQEVHRAIRHLHKGLYEDSFCKILPYPFEDKPELAYLMHADTAGSKTALAYIWYRETGDLSVWKGVVQDALVMNTDDMVCSGGLNDFVASSTILRNARLIPGEVLKTIIEAGQEMAEMLGKYGIRLHLAGGETADVGDVVRTIDVGFTLSQVIPREQIIRIRPEPGDLVVGVASYGQARYENEYNSGIGSNGLTAARHELLHAEYKVKYPESLDNGMPEELAYCGKFRLQDIEMQTGLPVGKLLLSPTRTFLPALHSIIPVFRRQIHGIIHNTGGGYTKAIKFLCGLQMIKTDIIPVPPVFQLIEKHTPMNLQEMFRNFNMGQRLEIFCPRETAEELIKAFAEFGLEARITGEIRNREKQDPAIEIRYKAEILRYF